MHCATAACALQQAHRDSVLALECKAKAEEGQDHHTFMIAFGVAIGACLAKSHGTLLYPLQLLTGDVPLAAILGMLATAQLWAISDRGSVSAAPTPSVSGTPALQVGIKCQHCSSDQGVPTSRQDEVGQLTLTTCPKNILTVSKRREGQQGRP